jgi:hypothetical protein
MRVKHGTKFRVVITCGLSTHRDPCSDDIVPAEHLDGHLTVAAVMHGKVSGHDSGIRVKQRVSLVDPSDELTGDQLCDCARCA